MQYIFTGVLGFIIFFCFDMASLKGNLFIKRAAFIMGHSFLAYSLLMVCIGPEKIELSRVYRLTGLVFSSVFFLIMIYSIFIEIPFKVTYIGQNRENVLVKTGTYGLVRHPGVLWYIFFLSGLFLMTGSKTLLFALPVWSAVDIIYIVLQERFIFIKMFGEEYREYQQEVPILIPTRKSIKRCVSTLNSG
ncbi:MAG TPA: hypothetical protein ENI15_00020 [Spirochaetes bacterium]|nr:hypothetical protein [Spirochaetota bacterium]